MHRLSIPLGISLLSLSAGVQLQRNSDGQGMPSLRVALLGDSLTFGNASLTFNNRPRNDKWNERGSYPEELKSLLEDKFGSARSVEVTVFARIGIRGMAADHDQCKKLGTCQDSCDVQFADDLKSCSYQETPEWEAAQAFDADVFIVMLGTNDAKNEEDIVSQWWKKDMTNLLKTLQNSHKTSAFLILDPPDTDSPREYSPTSLDVVHKEVPRMAAELGIPYISIKKVTPVSQAKKFFINDGVHFTPLACVEVAKAVFDGMFPYVWRQMKLTGRSSTASNSPKA